MDEEVTRFWQEFETSTGEIVEAKAVGEMFEESGDLGVWVLLVLTNRSFWFKQVPTDNPLESLFRLRKLSGSARGSEAFTLSIPRGNLMTLQEPERGGKGWFSKPAFPGFTLSWREGDVVRRRRFTIDPSAGLLPRLRALFKDVQPAEA